MKKKFSQIVRWLGPVLMLLLVTACGKGAGSRPGLSTAEGRTASAAEQSSRAEIESTVSSSRAESVRSSLSSREETLSAESGEASGTSSAEASGASEDFSRKIYVTEDGQYSSKAEVAAYLHQFGHLPSNYISKSKAIKLGWDASARNLWLVAPGMSIGGGHFGNYEGVLPDGDYRECDIDYEGGGRNAKRLVYSDDGRIYYTEDHYKTFERLY